jgi:hypothetical protein
VVSSKIQALDRGKMPAGPSSGKSILASLGVDALVMLDVEGFQATITTGRMLVLLRDQIQLTLDPAFTFLMSAQPGHHGFSQPAISSAVGVAQTTYPS